MTENGGPVDWLRNHPIAHRGLHDAAGGRPENSLPAFEAAARAGYAIELDVRLTRDREVVVFHDDRLQRLTGDPGAVAQRTLAELGHLRLQGGPSVIPTLTQVLDLLDGAVPLLIEIKNTDAPGPLEEHLLATLEGYHGEVAVQSFNPLSLAWFAEHAPAIVRGQLSGSFAGSDLDEALCVLLRDLQFNEMTRPAFVAYELAALPYPAATAARDAGLPLIAWTVRTPADLEKARAVADNIIFEAIDPGDRARS